jgi:hypothetical protein
MVEVLYLVSGVVFVVVVEVVCAVDVDGIE